MFKITSIVSKNIRYETIQVNNKLTIYTQFYILFIYMKGRNMNKRQDMLDKLTHIEKWRVMLIELRLTQKDFCDDHEISESAFSRWLAGEIIPRWKTIKNIDEKFKLYKKSDL